jgi:hypothetical protein
VPEALDPRYPFDGRRDDGGKSEKRCVRAACVLLMQSNLRFFVTGWPAGQLDDEMTVGRQMVLP